MESEEHCKWFILNTLGRVQYQPCDTERPILVIDRYEAAESDISLVGSPAIDLVDLFKDTKNPTKRELLALSVEVGYSVEILKEGLELFNEHFGE